MSGGYYQFQVPQIRVIPIAKADKAQQSAVEEIVDRILSAKADDPNADTSALEKEIDHLVYAHYGLTPDEICLVEESAPSPDRHSEPVPDSSSVA